MISYELYVIHWTWLRSCDAEYHKTELIDAFAPDHHSVVSSNTGRDVIGIKGMIFSWDASAVSGTSTPSTPRRNFRLRVDGEVLFRRGGINLIVGPTGSGKTSLLMALLGRR